MNDDCGKRYRPTYSNAERELRVLESVADVWNNVGLVNTDGEDLPLAVDSKNAGCVGVGGRDEDSFSADAVHVDACSGLDVVQVDVSELEIKNN